MITFVSSLAKPGPRKLAKSTNKFADKHTKLLSGKTLQHQWE